MNDLTREIIIIFTSHILTFIFLIETLKKRKFKRILIEFFCLAIISLIWFFIVKSMMFIWVLVEISVLLVINIIIFYINSTKK